MPTYILLPPAGFVNDVMKDLERSSPLAGGGVMPTELNRAIRATGAASDIDVIDRVSKDGPKLVSMSPVTAARLRTVQGGFRVVPVRKYRPALRPMRRIRTKGLFSSSKTRTSIQLLLRAKSGGAPIQDAIVIAILDPAIELGLHRRRSTASGTVTLTFPGTKTKVAELLVYPPSSYWGYYARNIVLTDQQVISLESINLSTADVLQTTYAKRGPGRGKGVRVGVIDTGIARNHPDLAVSGGYNFMSGSPNDYDDVRDHGTHVAGILAGRGAKGSGMSGIAPDVALMAYRVFDAGRAGTDTMTLLKAVNKAVQDGCDIINMSLGGGLPDIALNEAIGDAFGKGVICVVAAGNDSGKPVCYPAWFKRALGVSAFGRQNTFPGDSVEHADIGEISITNKFLFLASFSNIGAEIDYIAPGVGVISAAPGGLYSVKSGTSMACPVVAGVAAALLSAAPQVLKMPRTAGRSHAIFELLRNAAQPQGFRLREEGFGLPVG